MHRFWFSASVLVRSRSEEWRSSFATPHCCPESVQSLSRWWKYTRVTRWWVCLHDDGSWHGHFHRMRTFTSSQTTTFTLCSDHHVGKPLCDRLWGTTSASLERSDLGKLICDDVDHLVGERVDGGGSDVNSTEYLRTVSSDARTIFLTFRNINVMTRVFGWLKVRFACTNRWSVMQPVVPTGGQWCSQFACTNRCLRCSRRHRVQRLIATQLYQSPRCPEDCRHDLVMWRAGLVRVTQATMPDCRQDICHQHPDSWRRHRAPVGRSLDEV